MTDLRKTARDLVRGATESNRAAVAELLAAMARTADDEITRAYLIGCFDIVIHDWT